MGELLAEVLGLFAEAVLPSPKTHRGQAVLCLGLGAAAACLGLAGGLFWVPPPLWLTGGILLVSLAGAILSLALAFRHPDSRPWSVLGVFVNVLAFASPWLALAFTRTVV